MARRLKWWVVATIVVVVATACSSGTSPADDDSRAQATDAADSATSSTAPATTTTAAETGDDPESTPDELAGLVAVGGSSGLGLVDPVTTNRLRSELTEHVVTQPTWSRDGSRLVATALSLTDGPEVTVVPADGGELTRTVARRPYFFYSWSADGSRIAALGPGPNGTSLDILTADGTLANEHAIDSGSLYLAWEPDGDDLLLHANTEVALVTEVDGFTSVRSLGLLGQVFLAPAWIPGTREALVVDAADGGGRLIRLDVDTGDRVDLGETGAGVGIAVAADGSRALVAHSDRAGDGGPITVSFDPRVQSPTATTELIDLESGERTPVNHRATVWAEWSPDGSELLLIQIADAEFEVAIFAEDELEVIGAFQPSATFIQNYLFFSWQYVETPRLWSPDGEAVVLPSRIDGVDHVMVQPVHGGEAWSVAETDIGFWSPG